MKLMIKSRKRDGQGSLREKCELYLVGGVIHYQKYLYLQLYPCEQLYNKIINRQTKYIQVFLGSSYTSHIIMQTLL